MVGFQVGLKVVGFGVGALVGKGVGGKTGARIGPAEGYLIEEKENNIHRCVSGRGVKGRK